MAQAVNVGIIIPIHHQALEDIKMGITEQIEEYNSIIINQKDKINIFFGNAQGDQTLMRQIIIQMRNKGVDYFMPIGTLTTEMTISIVKNKTIIGVAAEIDINKLKKKNKNVSVVSDKISPKSILSLIKKYIKKIKKIGLIYSNSEKIFPEIEEAKKFCEKNNLELSLKKINTISEIYQFGESLIKNNDALLILKDNLVVSGITGLVKIAKKNKKLLITEDDGSVKKGASFALGVVEKSIGIKAGETLIKIIKNGLKEEYRSTCINELSIFYNPKTFNNQNFLTEKELIKIAKNLSIKIYPVSK
ncbi:MAG: hypothetical protein GY830_05180 [Bacteroidetes bacterium]|nr:hypothetical protein [Bacteroidota bacterium]